MEKHFEIQAYISVDVRTMALSLGGDPLTSGILHCTLVRIKILKKSKCLSIVKIRMIFFPLWTSRKKYVRDLLEPRPLLPDSWGSWCTHRKETCGSGKKYNRDLITI